MTVSKAMKSIWIVTLTDGYDDDRDIAAFEDRADAEDFMLKSGNPEGGDYYIVNPLKYYPKTADSLTAELQKENARLAKSLTDVRECPQCGALCELHAELSFEALSGKSLENTAGLEKENARLREALEKIMGCVGTSTESWHIVAAALSKEKAK